MLWFTFILGLNFIFFYFELIIIQLPYPKTKENKFKPRRKLNHNIYICNLGFFVMNRVRVSNAQRFTYTQILVEYPLPRGWGKSYCCCIVANSCPYEVSPIGFSQEIISRHLQAMPVKAPWYHLLGVCRGKSSSFICP